MTRRWWLAACTALALGACGKEGNLEREVTIAAATSLRAVLPELARAYEARHPGVHITATFGSSGDLRKQVEGGAPVDAVIFAGGKPVDVLIAAGRAGAQSRRVVATNQLVLIAPKEQKRERSLTFATLDTLGPGEMLAIGDPGAVPAGQYAHDYLKALGKWDALSGKLVLGGDVAAVLAYARRGEVAAAVVYRTEIRGIANVVVLDEAKGPGAPRPEVVSAVVSGARNAAEAGSFLTFVASPDGRTILESYGFGPP